MKLEDLNNRELELYQCKCPSERPCPPRACAEFKAYYDALFAGKSQDEAATLAAEVGGLLDIKAKATIASRTPSGCRFLGDWTGRLCDERQG